MLETRLRAFVPDTTGGTAGGAGGASTASTFVTYTADGGLSAEKVLTASNNIIITTDATAIYISANTGAGGSGSIYAPTGGSYVAYAADLSLTNERILTAGSSVTIVTDATAIYINALTGGGATTVYAPTGGNYVAFAADASLTNEKILTAGSSVTIVTDATAIYINALTNSGSGPAGTSKAIIGQSVPGTSATRYGAPFGNVLDAAQANVSFFEAPYDGTAKNLRFRIQTAPGAPASGRAWNGIVYLGANSTALRCQIFEVQTAASDLTNTVSIVSGNTISFAYERVGTTAAPGNMSIGFEFDAT